MALRRNTIKHHGYVLLRSWYIDEGVLPSWGIYFRLQDALQSLLPSWESKFDTVRSIVVSLSGAGLLVRATTPEGKRGWAVVDHVDPDLLRFGALPYTEERR